jgi:hypothetical protein
MTIPTTGPRTGWTTQSGTVDIWHQGPMEIRTVAAGIYQAALNAPNPSRAVIDTTHYRSWDEAAASAHAMHATLIAEAFTLAAEPAATGTAPAPGAQHQDAIDLTAALALIRAAHPAVVTAHFTTTDQHDGYGFFISVLALADGTQSAPGPELAERVDDLVCDIDWGGVMGEDEHGYAAVPVTLVTISPTYLTGSPIEGPRSAPGMDAR